MDLSPIHTQDPHPSSSSANLSQSIHQSNSQPSSTVPTINTDTPRTLRSSTRAKAAKEKDKGKERDTSDQTTAAAPSDSSSSRHNRPTNPSSSSKRAREPSGKGKGKEIQSPDESSSRAAKKYVPLSLPRNSRLTRCNPVCPAERAEPFTLLQLLA